MYVILFYIIIKLKKIIFISHLPYGSNVCLQTSIKKLTPNPTFASISLSKTLNALNPFLISIWLNADSVIQDG
jgi:hypothetical protein